MLSCKIPTGEQVKIEHYLDELRKEILNVIRKQARYSASTIGKAMRAACPGSKAMKSSIKWRVKKIDGGSSFEIYTDYKTKTTEKGKTKIIDYPIAIWVLEYGRGPLPASPRGRPIKVKTITPKYYRTTETGEVPIVYPSERKKWSAEGYIIRKGPIRAVKGKHFLRNTWNVEKKKLIDRVSRAIVFAISKRKVS